MLVGAVVDGAGVAIGGAGAVIGDAGLAIGDAGDVRSDAGTSCWCCLYKFLILFCEIAEQLL